MHTDRKHYDNINLRGVSTNLDNYCIHHANVQGTVAAPGGGKGGQMPPQNYFLPPHFAPPVLDNFCRNHWSLRAMGVGTTPAEGDVCEKWPNVVETSELDRQNCKNL